MRKYDVARVNVARRKASDLTPRTENPARIPKGSESSPSIPHGSGDVHQCVDSKSLPAAYGSTTLFLHQ
jgi:hypothetical protein